MSETSTRTDKLNDEAIEWLIRLNAEPCPPGDKQAFEHWLQQSPAHQKAYEEIAHRSNLLKRAVATNEKTRHDALSYRPRKKISARPHSWKLATAASILLLIGVATFSSEGWYGWNKQIAVGHGDKKTVELADGSRLEINTDSEVNIRINRWQRSVELVKGEVYFSVIHDAAKPFIVTTGSVRTVDIGTEFDIYRHADGEVVVAVKEGSVRIEGKQTRELQAAQSASYNPSGEFTETANDVSLDALLAWRQGKLIFNNRRLADVLNEIGRYHHVQIRVEEARLGDKRLSGTFPINQFESNLAVITQGLGLTVQHQADGRIVIAKR
ncbi:FecR family protein [Methylomonas sp. YC3]